MRQTIKAMSRKTMVFFLLLAMAVGLFAFPALGLDVPTGVSASATGTSSIAISWSPVSGATGYNISRSTSPDGGYTVIGISNSTGYTDWGLSSGTTYYYKIAATDGSSQTSVDSAPASTTTHVTVTFNLMGGAMDSPATSVVPYGSAVSSPSYPYRTKHRFAGWCSDAAGNSAYSFSSAVTSNITLYAKWTPEYTVTYYRNQDSSDGVNVLGDFYVLYDRVDLSPITSVGHTKTNWYRAGYSFAGWSKTRNGEILETPIYVIGSDIVLYAQYRESTYTVSFNLDGGKGVVEPQKLGYEDKVTKPADPVRDDYTFDGWFYKDNEWNFSTDTMPDGNITLTARWLEGRPFIVTFDFGDGRQALQQQTQSNSLVERPEDPERDGYTFKGWLNNGNTWDFETEKMPAKNVTLKASWEKDPKAAAVQNNLPDGTQKPGGYGFDDKITMQTGNLFSDIAQGNVPIGGFGQKGYFSVLSLLIMMASLVVSFIVAFRVFSKKKANGFRRHMTALIGVFAAVMGILVIASFFLQQDFSAPKMLITNTTLLTGLLFLLQVNFVVIYFRKGSQKVEWADYSKEASALFKVVYR